MKSRKEIKLQAKGSFLDYYWPCVGAGVLVSVLLIAASNCSAGLAGIVLAPALCIGSNLFFLAAYSGEHKDVGAIFSDGFHNFGRKLGGYLWMCLFMFLWSLLFLIPGIIKAFSYAMTPYILGDCENVKAKDALKLSMRMMKGHKWELFVLNLSFIGWDLLSLLTLGLLNVFLVQPYRSTALAGFYRELKQYCIESGTIPASDFEGEPAKEI